VYENKGHEKIIAYTYADQAGSPTKPAVTVSYLERIPSYGKA